MPCRSHTHTHYHTLSHTHSLSLSHTPSHPAPSAVAEDTIPPLRPSPRLADRGDQSNELQTARGAHAFMPPLKGGGGVYGLGFFHGLAFFHALPATFESLICWPETGCHGLPFFHGW